MTHRKTILTAAAVAAIFLGDHVLALVAHEPGWLLLLVPWPLTKGLIEFLESSCKPYQAPIMVAADKAMMARANARTWRLVRRVAWITPAVLLTWFALGALDSAIGPVDPWMFIAWLLWTNMWLLFGVLQNSKRR